MRQIISSVQAKMLIKQGAQLIDVRTQSEFRQDAAPGAKNFPVKFLQKKAANLNIHKPVIVYCHTGGRSAKAQQLLEKIGFLHVHNAGSIHNYLID